MANNPDAPEVPEEVLYPDIFACARQGNVERLNYLLDQEGVDPNSQGRNGTTALMMAVGRGHTEAVSTLLQHGSLTDLKDRHGFTAILMAADAGTIIAIIFTMKTPKSWHTSGVPAIYYDDTHTS